MSLAGWSVRFRVRRAVAIPGTTAEYGSSDCAGMQPILPLFPVGWNARDLDLLTTNRVAYGLEVIGAGLADDHSFGDARGFADDCLLCDFEHFDHRMGPFDILDVVRIWTARRNPSPRSSRKVTFSSAGFSVTKRRIRVVMSCLQKAAHCDRGLSGKGMG